MDVQAYDRWDNMPDLDEEATLTENTGPEAKSAGDPQLFHPNEIDDPSLSAESDDPPDDPPADPGNGA
jgi:hypothetical protein